MSNMSNYCSQCGQSLSVGAVGTPPYESQYDTLSRLAKQRQGMNCLPAGSVVDVPFGFSLNQALGMAQMNHETLSYWHSVNCSLSAEEMEAERERKKRKLEYTPKTNSIKLYIRQLLNLNKTVLEIQRLTGLSSWEVEKIVKEIESEE